MTHNKNVPFQLVGIDHIVLLINDMDKAMHFYQQVLGCASGYSYPDLEMEQVWCGPQLIVLIDTTKRSDAIQRAGVATDHNVDHFCLSIGPFDKDELRTYLQSNNVEITREAFHGGGRGMGEAFYILDPFGNTIELKGPPVI